MRRILLKVLILLSTAYAIVQMWHWAIGFTFFTQLSNLYAAAVVLLQLICDRRWVRMQKFAATVSILITFAVFLFALAPMVPGGILAAYRQDHYASFCLHILTPLLMLTDFLLNDTDEPWRLKHVSLSLIPPAGYFVFILVLGACGMRWNGMTAPYFFLNYDAPAGWFGYLPETASYRSSGIGVFYAVLIMLVLFYAVGALLLLLTRLLQMLRRSQKESGRERA